MRIVQVEAIPVRAPMRSGEVYWGNQSWGRNKPARAPAAGLPPADDRASYPALWRSRAAYSQSVDTTVVKISTDSGLVGWGEAKAPVAPEITAAIIRQVLAGLLVGEDPTNPALQWERMYGAMRIRGHATGFWMEAISGIDIALWDLTGKALNMPLHKLLGGAFRERVKIYASGIPGVRQGAPDEAWEELRAAAEEIRRRGFQAVKMGIGLGVAGDIRSVETVREVLGRNFTIFADAAGMYDLPQALELGRTLERLEVGWFEAPLPPEEVENYGRLSQSLNIAIASDLIYNRWQVRNLLLAGGVHVVQPDVCRAGGITECKRIAELADAFQKATTPHVSIGSAIHFAASVQLAAALPNQTLMEYWYGSNPLGDPIQQTPFRVEDSYFWVPEGPGLGVEIDEEALRRYAV
ncbi:MAG: mandelate racemase/muconate lactonizing enzyme family protein [Ardenticatenaceae bacterium]|nr:mandelate racemase/muconate lactonizing enzyme family protein [Ardenticatenaceae bacterium]